MISPILLGGREALCCQVFVQVEYQTCRSKLLSLGVTASDRASGDLLCVLGVTIIRVQQVSLTPPPGVQGIRVWLTFTSWAPNQSPGAMEEGKSGSSKLSPQRGALGTHHQAVSPATPEALPALLRATAAHGARSPIPPLCTHLSAVEGRGD